MEQRGIPHYGDKDEKLHSVPYEAGIQRDRSWQRRCIDDIRRVMAEGQRDYLVNAPDVGKINLSCRLAKELVGDGAVDFVVVVIPMGGQAWFIKTMKDIGGPLFQSINDDEAWDNVEAVGPGRDAKGFCLTPEMFSQVPRKLRALIDRYHYKVLWVIDERHMVHSSYNVVSAGAVLRLGLSD